MNTLFKQTLIGGLIWAFFTIVTLIKPSIPTIDFIAFILLFAILIIVPFALTIVKRNDAIYGFARSLQLPAGILATGSFFLDQGVWATVLALPWLVFTVLLALSGLVGIVIEKQTTLPAPLLKHIALVYIAIGGGWLVLHRTGMPVLDFSDNIILLTSIHFHYSAFTAPIVMAVAGKRMCHNKPGLTGLYKAISVGAILSPPFVAIGITFSDVIEFISVCLFVVVLLLYAGLSFIYLIPKIRLRLASVLFSLSSALLIVSMLFALLYGLGHVSNNLPYTLTIPTMVLVHGVLNSIGFGFCGIVGSYLLNQNDAVTAGWPNRTQSTTVKS